MTAIEISTLAHLMDTRRDILTYLRVRKSTFFRWLKYLRLLKQDKINKLYLSYAGCSKEVLLEELRCIDIRISRMTAEIEISELF